MPLDVQTNEGEDEDSLSLEQIDFGPDIESTFPLETYEMIDPTLSSSDNSTELGNFNESTIYEYEIK